MKLKIVVWHMFMLWVVPPSQCCFFAHGGSSICGFQVQCRGLQMREGDDESLWGCNSIEDTLERE